MGSLQVLIRAQLDSLDNWRVERKYPRVPLVMLACVIKTASARGPLLAQMGSLHVLICIDRHYPQPQSLSKNVNSGGGLSTCPQTRAGYLAMQALEQSAIKRRLPGSLMQCMLLHLTRMRNSDEVEPTFSWSSAGECARNSGVTKEAETPRLLQLDQMLDHGPRLNHTGRKDKRFTVLSPGPR